MKEIIEEALNIYIQQECEEHMEDKIFSSEFHEVAGVIDEALKERYPEIKRFISTNR